MGTTQKAWVSQRERAAREMAEQGSDVTWVALVVDSFDLCARHARLVRYEADIHCADEPGDFVVEIGRRCGVTVQSDNTGSRQFRYDVRYTFSAENTGGFVRAEIAPSGRIAKREYLEWSMSAAQRIVRDVNESGVMWFLIEPVPLLVRAEAAAAQQRLGGGLA